MLINKFLLITFNHPPVFPQLLATLCVDVVMGEVMEVTKALEYHIVAFKIHVCRMLVRANLKGRADFKALCNFTARGMAHALSYRAQGGFTNLMSRGDYTASLDFGFGFALY